jgi:hypothetical protein
MKNLKISLFAFGVVALVFLGGCNGGPFCMSPKGNEVTQTIALDAFTGIALEIASDVTIHKGEVQSVTITGRQNIIDNIERNVVGGVWKIRFDECVRNEGNLNIDITIPNLKEVAIAGSGSVVSTDSFVDETKLVLSIAGSGSIDVIVSATNVETSIAGSGDIHLGTAATSVKADIAGSGDIFLEGTCSDLDADIAGSGSIHAYDLFGETGTISISGSGNCEVNVSQSLDVTISGSGSVFYKGTPTVDTQISGSGTVKHVN